MRLCPVRHWFLFGLLFLCCVPIRAAEIEVEYQKDVRPFLSARCFACHGALKQEAALRLDAAYLVRQGGESGAAIVPGQATKSLIIQRVSSPDDSFRMPPEGHPLTPEEIQLLTAWIDAGAPAPLDDRPLDDPRDHWAFRPPVRAPLPAVARAEWSTHPIDTFVAAEHEAHELQPLPRTSTELLLRRLYIDLIGLPPSREEVRAFTRATSSTNEGESAQRAVERVVDDLLARPQHGERWGRHWMDVWRYSEWYGLGPQVRNSQKHMWHWRDWIIESINEDKGYDQMLREMLAADELYPTDSDVLRATGFLARNYYLFNRTTWLDDTIEHTSKAFLGLTMNCAKCHDHKFDPLTHVDYYRFRAIFEPHQVRLDPVPGEIDLERDALPRVFDLHPDAPTYLHLRGDEKEPDKSHPLQPGVPAILATDAFQVQEIALPPRAYFPALRRHVLSDQLEAATDALLAAEREVDEAQSALADASAAEVVGAKSSSAEVKPEVLGPAFRLRIAEATQTAATLRTEMLRTAHAADVARHIGAAETEGQEHLQELTKKAARTSRAYELAKAEERVLRAQRGVETAAKNKKAKSRKALTAAEKRLTAAKESAASGGDKKYTSLRASRKAPEGPAEKEASLQLPYPPLSTGRRSALARWLVAPSNPLVARVAVNHIWMRHFGDPLVSTVTDFGLRAPRPPLAKLLDWLAVELIESGWSMKHLHRLIVTSRVYALSSSTRRAHAATHAKDPNNAFYWRRRPVRMESQAIRDSLLTLAGKVRHQLGGSSIRVGEKGEALRRRSVYFQQSRDEQNKFLSMFDDADILRCYRRTESIVPQQALALANSKLALEMARETAARIVTALESSKSTKGSAETRFLRLAYETVLGVTPSPEELKVCRNTLEQMQNELSKNGHADPAKRARENVVHALINHNDFITLR